MIALMWYHSVGGYLHLPFKFLLHEKYLFCYVKSRNIAGKEIFWGQTVIGGK